MALAPAVKKKSKLKILIGGTAGAGKTYSALEMAKVLLGEDYKHRRPKTDGATFMLADGTEIGAANIALIDSEHDSSTLYADIFVGEDGYPAYDADNLDSMSVSQFSEKVSYIASKGYKILIIDSFSPAWMSSLEKIDRLGGWVKGGKSVSPEYAGLIQKILAYPGHVIVTGRMTSDTVIEKDEKTGKMIPKKLGMKFVAREGLEYEFSVVLILGADGSCEVAKTRCPALTGHAYMREDMPKIARTVADWLNGGQVQSDFETAREKLLFATSGAELEAVLAAFKGKTYSDAERQELGQLLKSRRVVIAASEALP